MTEKKRGFEIISQYNGKNITLPKRATMHSAGYDIESAETIVLPAFWKQLFKYVLKEMKQWIYSSPSEKKESESRITTQLLKPTLVPTGLKVYMQEDEYLQLVNRSSGPLKRFLVLPNGVGVVDKDYYNNAENEGHIYIQLLNFGLVDQTIEKGDRIAQGIFHQFLLVDDDVSSGNERIGGFGSSDN